MAVFFIQRTSGRSRPAMFDDRRAVSRKNIIAIENGHRNSEFSH